MAKHKYIETPEKMWELFKKYRKHVKENPRVKVEYVGKDGFRVDTPLVTPLTLEGFKSFGYDNNVTISHYFDNTDKAYDEYRAICSRVRGVIRQDQIEGGMVGQYNASITQRLNNLQDKQQVENISPPPLFPDVPTDNSDK